MSFVVDQVRLIDNRLNQLPLSKQPPGDSFSITATEAHDAGKAARIARLHKLIKNLSATTSSRHPLVSIDTIRSTLHEAHFHTAWQPYVDASDSEPFVQRVSKVDPEYEHELEWLLLGKATSQIYGAVLNAILDRGMRLEDDIWYWKDIASTYRYARLYSIQTSPIRLWRWSLDIYNSVRSRDAALDTTGWSRFYGIVKKAVRERSIADIQRGVFSPVALAQIEGRKKASELRKTRLKAANAIGLLLGDGLGFDEYHGKAFSMQEIGFEGPGNQHKWKGVIAKNIALMEAVLKALNAGDMPEMFEDTVIGIASQDDYYITHESSGEVTTDAFLRPADVAARLDNMLIHVLPSYSSTHQAILDENGRPSALIRYWLPASILLLSSTTILRIGLNHKEEILTWIREFGQTVIDFWSNWVVEPTKKVIGTIRHDESSEVSILSKRSLQGDRESLERMVVDFAIAHPDGPALNDYQIADIRAKVREGDLTLVLKAYEKDMQKPVMRAITGNLINTLLIQIQKTKVDVDVAMSGIDSILKSQELLFGFIGLTPGVLVSIGVYQWLKGVFGGRSSLESWQKEGQLLLILINIDRILAGAQANTTEDARISYEDQGLLLFEVHRLRQAASGMLPQQMFGQFLEDVDVLIENCNGFDKQLKAAQRLRGVVQVVEK